MRKMTSLLLLIQLIAVAILAFLNAIFQTYKATEFHWFLIPFYAIALLSIVGVVFGSREYKNEDK